MSGSVLRTVRRSKKVAQAVKKESPVRSSPNGRVGVETRFFTKEDSRLLSPVFCWNPQASLFYPLMARSTSSWKPKLPEKLKGLQANHLVFQPELFLIATGGFPPVTASPLGVCSTTTDLTSSMDLEDAQVELLAEEPSFDVRNKNL